MKIDENLLIESTQKKFTNTWIAGAFLTIVAYRGKLGPISRLLVGATGVAMIYKNYKTVVEKNPNATVEDHLKAYVEGAKGVAVDSSYPSVVQEEYEVSESEPLVLVEKKEEKEEEIVI